MIYTYPDYYEKFNCLMGECPMSCCKGWLIGIEDNLLDSYSKCTTCFGARLKNEVDFEEGIYKQYDGRCAFLNDQDLCDIHIEAGINMMSQTCKDYPKHIEEFENEREISYTLSCPAMAKIILENKNIVTFITKEDDIYEEDEDFEFFLYEALQDTRKKLFEILQNRDINIYSRLFNALELTKHVQNCIYDADIFNIYDVNENYKIDQNKRINTTSEFLLKGLEILKHLSILEKEWNEDLIKWTEYLEKNRNIEFHNVINEIELEQIIVYYIFTYFCGGVYDGEILTKMYFSVFGTLMFDGICKIENAINDKLSEYDKQVIAFRYSREVEHADENIDDLEIALYNNNSLFNK